MSLSAHKMLLIYEKNLEYHLKYKHDQFNHLNHDDMWRVVFVCR